MLERLLVALLAIIMMTALAAGQDKDRPPVAVPDLSGFSSGDEMLGVLSTYGIKGRIGAQRPAPSEDLQGRFGQDPAAGVMLDPDTHRVTIFRYGAYVAPDPAKTASPGSMDAMIAGSEAEFIGSYAGTMKMGDSETPITVGITNSGAWSIFVGVPTGTIGGSTGPGETTTMRDGKLVYQLDGASYQAVLSVKVTGDDLVGELATVLGTGESAKRTEATLTATRLK